MLMKPATLLKLWSVRKNVRGGRGALIFVEQLHPFIGIKYPRDEPLASELTALFTFGWWIGRSFGSAGPLSLSKRLRRAMLKKKCERLPLSLRAVSSTEQEAVGRC